MKRSPSIQLKAAFLLIVFSLNTVVGFACSVGLEMGFNSSHHQEEKAAITHKHDNSHQHDDAVVDHHQSEKTKDNCCKEEVIKFAKVDKVAPKSLDFSFPPVFFATFLSSFYHLDASLSYQQPNSKYFVRSYHPTIPKIRIAIQSFLI